MTDGLARIRLLYASFISAIVVLGVVVAVLDPLIDDSDAVPDAAAVAIVLLFGAIGVASPLLVERPLDCTDDTTLATTWTTRFLLRMAFAETPALVGFVVFVLTGQAWIYLVGLPFTAIGFVRGAPTEGRIEHDQADLATAGCGRSLREALRTARPGPAVTP